MDCTVVVVTHGQLAKQLVATCEMLIGKQENVLPVDFMPGENLESLIKKLAGIIEDNKVSGPLMMVVDMFSGSPFNASTWFVKNRPETKIVAGVNVPMLVNILLERQEAESFDELVEMAVDVGQNAVKSLQN